MTKYEEVIIDLIKAEVIPATQLFDINENMLNAYIRLYSSNTRGNGKFDCFYARKLAGMNLLKHKFKWLSGNYKNCKEGFVYSISNPAWKDFRKVGMTIDINKRLSQFQTSSPLRDFKIDTYEFCLDRKNVEELVKNNFDLVLEDEGEWIKASSYLEIAHFLRECTMKPNFAGLNCKGCNRVSKISS